MAIYSGQRLTGDPALGLDGECDFIIAAGAGLPVMAAPLVTVVEAKRQDMELGAGQCVAEMVALRLFNERAGDGARPVFGCVTTGETWQFLRLDGSVVTFDADRYYLTDVGLILAAVVAAVEQALAVTGPPAPPAGGPPP